MASKIQHATNLWRTPNMPVFHQENTEIDAKILDLKKENVIDEKNLKKNKNFFKQSKSFNDDSFDLKKLENYENYTQLNQYKLLENIGQGSYGVVKLVQNIKDDKYYAMKILSKKKLLRKSGIFSRLPPKLQRDSNPNEIFSKIYREIAILKKLDHPNVVKLIEVLEDENGNFFLIFELLEYELLKIPTENYLQENIVWNYFRDIVLGLEYLHYQKIVHRDIKPGNLLINKSGNVSISDLGISNEFQGNDDWMSKEKFGLGSGTPAFLAPEILENVEKFRGKAADIWALGITLYSLIYGNVPFYDENIIKLNEKIKNDEIKFPEKPEISNDLKDLIKKMLIKKPELRITLNDIKSHRWVTKNEQNPLPTETENCKKLIEITDDDLNKVLTKIPKFQTLILIKNMIKNHSFQNPFVNKLSKSRKLYGQSGRSNSAPDSCNFNSINSSLESIEEITDDKK